MDNFLQTIRVPVNADLAIQNEQLCLKIKTRTVKILMTLEYKYTEKKRTNMHAQQDHIHAKIHHYHIGRDSSGTSLRRDD